MPVQRVVQQGDTFPAALGYAAVALATTVWGIMCAVINHLWKRTREQDTEHAAAMKATHAAHAAALKAKDDALAAVQEARRTESEKLLREQKEIFAEVMVTTSKIGAAFDENQGATVRLHKLVEHLVQVVESWRKE